MEQNSPFTNLLILWYLKNKRDLPWRKTKNPYQIWLSEIILQQTKISQGTAYYLKFIDNFPTVQSLANAREEDVLKLWQGLGYYSRARNLHKTAIHISTELQGVFPENYNDLIKLKGIGDYTASAIASICFNGPNATVDGNVYRLLSRYFGISTPINSSKGIKEFKMLAQKLLNTKIPGTHNQAIMEFGARMCKPQSPDCEICPLNSSCVALEKKEIKILPVKENKIKIKNRYFNYLVVHTEDNMTIVEKRTKGIWTNLFQFPLIETTKRIEEKQLFEMDLFNTLFNSLNISVKVFNNDLIVHKLSHQHIFTTFWIIKTPKTAQFSINWNTIEQFPVPVLINNFLMQYKSN